MTGKVMFVKVSSGYNLLVQEWQEYVRWCEIMPGEGRLYHVTPG